MIALFLFVGFWVLFAYALYATDELDLRRA